MATLYNVESPINREQRNNINATFSDILIRLTNLRYQISILAGGEDLEQIIQSIQDTITNAQNTTANTQQVLDDITAALSQLQTTIQNSENATTAANQAATQAISDVNEAISNLQENIDHFGNAEEYNNSKTYRKNNVVEYNGSSFMALQESTGNAPPTLPLKRNSYWNLLAQRGIDGSGSVSSVNSKSPDVSGNILLNANDLGAVSNTNYQEHLNDITKHRVSILDFGAAFDGVTDDTAAFQSAIDYLETLEGGTLYLPKGTSLINSTITINKPIYIIGQGKGNDSNNTNGSGLGTTTIRWTNPVGATMFEFVSSESTNTLIGGGMSEILLDGSQAATNGFRCRSCGYMEFDSLEGRNFINEFGLIDDSNGVLSQFNRFADIHFVYGAGAVTENSNGLVFYGSSSVGVTQNHIISITGLVSNGYVLVFKTSDNNVVEKCHGVVLGTGGSVLFGNGIYADSNVINYLVGKVKSESLAFGNRILHWNSEGGGLDLAEGSVIHYTVYDYNQVDIFETLKYKMTDSKTIDDAAVSIIDNTVTRGLASGQWSCINLSDSTDSKVYFSVPSQIHWADGVIKSLKIKYTQDNANTNNNFVLDLRCNITGTDGVLPGLNYSEITNLTAGPFPFVNQVAEIPLNLNYLRGQDIQFSFGRNGVSGDDTAVGNMQILSFEVLYQSNGPNSSGSGNYPVSRPYNV